MAGPALDDNKTTLGLRKDWWHYVWIGLLAAAVAVACWSLRGRVSLFDRMDRLTLDAQMLWRGPLAPATSPGIVVLAIDDASLRQQGGAAPDRRTLARTVRLLDAAGARLVAMDLLLIEPTRADPGADAELAQAMHQAGNVLLPFALPDVATTEARREADAAVLDSAFLSYASEAPAARVPLRPAGILAPTPALARSSLALGHVTVQRSAEGAVRYDLPAVPFDGEVYPSLALRAAALAVAANWGQTELRFGEGIRMAGLPTVPLDVLSRQWLNYYGPSGTFTTLPLVDLLEGRIAPQRLRGRIVLIGATALGAGDQFPSPFDASLPGVERMATSIDNMLTHRELRRPSWAAGAELLAMLCLPLLAALAIARWPVPRVLWAGGLLGLVLAAALQALFVERQEFLSLVFPALALGLGGGGALVRRNSVDRARRQAALLALRQSEERYALALRGANDGMWDWDIDGRHVYFSARWLQLMSLPAEQARDMAAWQLPLDATARQAFEAALNEHLEGRSPQFEFVLNFQQGGQDRWLLARGMALRDEAGCATRMAGSLTDISESQRLQRQLTYDALHDRLTGLPNRAAFLERLRQAYQGAGAGAAVSVGVVLVDINEFRTLNETEGSQACDELLRTLGRRLSNREGMSATVARVDADCFALLFQGELPSPGGEDPQRWAAWAMGRFEEPFPLGTKSLAVTGCVGWAHSRQGPNSADDLLVAAEMALAQAKLQGRGQLHRYDVSEQLVENSKRSLREDIDLGLERGEFRMYYQPLVNLADRKLIGFEALIRWIHPRRGFVMPGDFIPFAEESGQIVAMGRWTLFEAARQLVAWDQLGFRGEIAVNLSSRQFTEGNLMADAQAVRDILGALSPRRLKLEVTESMAMANPQLTSLALQELSAQGFKISIDDFGTGYSSLAYLHRFPFDTLKVDRSFVIRLDVGKEAVEIVRTIVRLALALDKQVLAEGVEEEAQARLLQELGVHVGQGWLFAKALPAGDAENYILKSLDAPVP
ncbi:MAG: EAL domain-containing protein [Burkholderiaceae bacterium]|nr:EAL domain-containing protein [Roseateles sp.]MBV8470782.1 EAL domain-containing protein [Burkholderiaceae bacterium]